MKSIELKEQNYYSKEWNINEVNEFYTKIIEKLQIKGFIDLLDYEKFKKINIDINTNTNFDDIILKEEIKNKAEKILSILKDKNEIEFIQDYFIGSSSHNFITNKFEYNNNLNEEELIKDYEINLLKKFTTTMNSLAKINETDLKRNNLYDMLPILSNNFLTQKLNLSEAEITQIKGSLDEPENEKEEKENEKEKESSKNPIIKNNNIENILLKNNKKELSSLFLKKSDNSSQVKLIEKELDEEINNEIFNYTKNMKQYAKSFNELLVRDNSKLDTIEKNQEGSKTKTDKSMKNLKEFSYNIRIGIFKLILMFIVVFTTFVITLLTIRIFPKLV